MPKTTLTYTEEDVAALIAADVRRQGMRVTEEASATFSRGDGIRERDYVTFRVGAEPEPKHDNSLGHQIAMVEAHGGRPYS